MHLAKRGQSSDDKNRGKHFWTQFLFVPPQQAGKKFDKANSSNDYASIVAWCCHVYALLFINC
jgi:hypothetical protein